MLYIHGLQHLTPKSMDVESTLVIREIRNRAKYPLSEDLVKQEFSQFFASEEDIQTILTAINLLPSNIEKVKKLILEQDKLHEMLNLNRTYQVLNEMPNALQNNLGFVNQTLAFKEQFAKELTAILNTIKTLKSVEEKKEYDKKITNLFRALLRHDVFSFNDEGIIDDARLKHIKDLSESLEKGYLFHFTLEEEMNRVQFDRVKLRIPPDKLEEGEAIKNEINIIKKGIEKSHELNMRMVQCAVFLYSYVKWVVAG
ncbi:MAG: hypothetical protein HYS32_03120 [Candidatus Woesearchaeota archaeon]|nr:MAG: hypothetical protein HYS32_03120 [Candidatus Woesearchaeota archaeon]